MAGKQSIQDVKAKLEKRFEVKPAEKDPWDEDAVNEAEGSNPRISLNLGITLPAGNYTSTRVDVGLTIDRIPGKSASQTFEWLEEVLLDKLDHAMSKLQEHVNERQ